jgi:putative tryptophan/tyrosine transport system substrate-binding protein
MRRREVITLFGGAAAAWPMAAKAQQSARSVVGWLDNTSASTTNRISAFREGLSAAGRSEVVIEPAFANGQLDRLPALAADLVRKRVAAIVTNNTSTPVAAAATSTIPIVFVTGGDPVEAGFVPRLNRPGGNVTGVSFNSAPVNPKRLELLHDLVPKPVVIAVLIDANFNEAQARQIEEAARMLGRQTFIIKAGNEREIDAAFATITQRGAGALFVGTGAFFNSRRSQIVALAAHHALPASYHLREFVEVGGLMSYGASDTDAFRRAGVYAGRIIKGERPGDLPVELPTKYELIVNLATAKALKIEIPPTLLAQADKVIE